VLSQIKKAHDCIGELELIPSADATKPEVAKDVNSKKRCPQVLFKTESDHDRLGSSDKEGKATTSSAEPQTGSAAVVDFSDVSLDWGLGKLVNNHNSCVVFILTPNACYRNDAQIFQIFPAAYYRWHEQQDPVYQIFTFTLQRWFLENFANPYPDDATKRRLIEEAKITERQLGNWLSNTRVRVWKPLLEKQRRTAETSAAAPGTAASGASI
jgi:hypothetical protein